MADHAVAVHTEEKVIPHRDNYEFLGRHRTILLAGMGIGLLCLVLTWFGDDELHTRFWSNYLHNSVFFMGISFMATFFIAVCITAWAGWHTTFKRVWEAISSFMIVGAVLMTVVTLGVLFHWHHLYHWTDMNDVLNDKVLLHKSKFLNWKWYAIGGTVVMAIWIVIGRKLRSLSLAEDESGDTSYAYHHKSRVWAAAFLALAGFSSAFVIWQWIMSIDAHWYSTMFAWYTGASWFVSMICLTILTIVFLKGQGYFPRVTNEHIHDLGKFLFAFSIFWTYLWFSQYMLIWYSNNGEETVYFHTRHQHYPVLFYANLAINFVLPFFVLMRNDTKRKWGSVGFIAVIVLFGHWLDFFLMIKPGVLHTADAALKTHSHGFMTGYTLPGFLEIGTFIGFLCGFLYWVLTALTKANLEAANDPYLAESVHHHV